MTRFQNTQHQKTRTSKSARIEESFRMVSKPLLSNHLRCEHRTAVIYGQSDISNDLKLINQIVKTKQSWHLNGQRGFPDDNYVARPHSMASSSLLAGLKMETSSNLQDPRLINIARQQDRFLVSRYNRTSQIRQSNNWLTKYPTFSTIKMPQNEPTTWDELDLLQWVEPLHQRRKSWPQKQR